MLRVRLKPGNPSVTVTLRDGTHLKMEQDEDHYVSEQDYLLLERHVRVMDEMWRILDKKTLRIYVPDGIGDLHWVFCKLEDLKRKCNATTIHLFVRDLSPARPRRVSDFIRLNPTVTTHTYVREQIAPSPEGYWVERSGYDYCLDPTPVLESGRPLENWMPDLTLNNHYKLKSVKSTRRPGLVVFYFGDETAAQQWSQGWTNDDWAKLTAAVTKSGRKPVAVGLKCDHQKADAVIACGGKFENWTGATGFLELLDYMAGADAVVGSCSGATILSAAFGYPTVIMWPGHDANRPLPEIMRYAGIDKGLKTYIPLAYNTPLRDVTAAISSVWNKA